MPVLRLPINLISRSLVSLNGPVCVSTASYAKNPYGEPRKEAAHVLLPYDL